MRRNTNDSRKSIRTTALASVAVLLMPKCPMCVAGYASVLAVLGISTDRYRSVIVPCVVLLFCIAAAFFVRSAVHHGRLGASLLGLVGAASIVLGKAVVENSYMMLVGLGVLLAAFVLTAQSRSPREGTNGRGHADSSCPCEQTIAKGRTIPWR